MAEGAPRRLSPEPGTKTPSVHAMPRGLVSYHRPRPVPVPTPITILLRTMYRHQHCTPSAVVADVRVGNADVSSRRRVVAPVGVCAGGTCSSVQECEEQRRRIERIRMFKHASSPQRAASVGISSSSKCTP